MHNRVFFPEAALDHWVSQDKIEVEHREVVLKPEGRRYRIVDAVYVRRELGGTGDVYGIVGKVKTVNFLHELGAELLGSSMLIGDSAYEVVRGFLGLPVGSLAEHRSTRSLSGAHPAVQLPVESDEELLARHLLEKL